MPAGNTSNTRLLGEEDKELVEQKQLNKDSEYKSLGVAESTGHSGLTGLKPPMDKYHSTKYDNTQTSSSTDPQATTPQNLPTVSNSFQNGDLVNNLETAAATAADNGHGDEESNDSTTDSAKQPLFKSKINRNR